LTSGSGVQDGKIRILDRRMRKKHPGSYFQDYLDKKMLKFFIADPDPGLWIRCLFDPGSGMEKFGSGINIPDPHTAQKPLSLTLTYTLQCAVCSICT
jgi:hypothetical protein